MKKFLYYLILTVTVLAVVALVGMAFRFAILRPDSNYHFGSGQLPEMGIPDCVVGAVCMLFAAPVCFVGSLLIRFLNYDDKKEV